MLKQKSLLTVAVLIVMVLLSGCSQSDGNSTSGDSKAEQEVIVINGHTLPPEPDPAINNATLLGVDVNKNGVRDDVERWIFKTYEHPIVQAVAMQNARAFQIILADPSKARDTVKFTEATTDCSGYYEYQDSRHIISKRKDLHEESRAIVLNTRERSRAYYEFNQALSGGIYPARPWDTLKDSCDFNETKIERGEW
jgi:hypothetical protein